MDEDIRTIWCGNLHEKVTEDILYELFMQGGPVQKVSIPKDRDGKQKNFGFVTYKHECSVPYALELFEGTVLFNRTVNMKSRNNTLENSYHLQQQQQQHLQHHLLQQQLQQQAIEFENKQRNIQNELQLGQQILLGAIAPLNFSQNSMYMMPGSTVYPSQTSSYSQNPQSSRDSSGRNYNRNHSRSHPYRDSYNDDRDNYNRHDKREDSYNRDHKSYKHSSHRSNRHDSRRKYR